MVPEGCTGALQPIQGADDHRSLATIRSKFLSKSGPNLLRDWRGEIGILDVPCFDLYKYINKN
jgi:hypothetical protein